MLIASQRGPFWCGTKVLVLFMACSARDYAFLHRARAAFLARLLRLARDIGFESTLAPDLPTFASHFGHYAGLD